MAQIVNNAVIPILGGSVTVEPASLFVLPVAAPGEGKGRLVHPTIGTYDYELQPMEWTGFTTDINVVPTWRNTRTLDGSITTLWEGRLKGSPVSERWTSGFGHKVDQLLTLQAMCSAPPDPAVAHVEWYPSYINDLGYKVDSMVLAVGRGKGVSIDSIIARGWVRGAVTLSMRIVDRL